MFLNVRIPSNGMINTRGPGIVHVIHKETVDIPMRFVCSETLDDAKLKMVAQEDAILELRPEDGGGAAVWMYPHQRDFLEPRLALWKGCYGAWPIKNLS